MMITNEQVQIYFTICTIISICIYTSVAFYILLNKGNKKSIISSIPMFLSFYFSLFFAGVFVFFGLSMAYMVAFQGSEVIGSTKTFAIVFGLGFAYFPVSIVIKLMKHFIYDSVITCVHTYN